MKIKNIIIVDGKEVDIATLPEKEREELFHGLNVKALTGRGYVQESTQETA